MTIAEQLDPIFKPETIAVIGASAQQWKMGVPDDQPTPAHRISRGHLHGESERRKDRQSA